MISGIRVRKVPVIIGLLMVVVLFALFFAQRAYSESEAQSSLDLGYKYISEGNYEAAIIAFEKVINIEPKNADAFRGIGIAYSAKGEYKKAEDYLKKAIAIRPDDSLSYEELSRIYIIEGDVKKANDILNTGIKNSNDISLQNTQSRLNEKTLIGQIFDSNSGGKISNASIAVFGGEGYNDEVQQTTSDEEGAYSTRLMPGEYKIEVSKAGYNSAEIYQKANGDSITYQASVSLIPKTDVVSYTITIKAKDAFTGKTLNGSNFKVDVVPGMYSDTPDLSKSIASGSIDENGRCVLTVPIGNYTAVVSSEKDNYKTASSFINAGSGNKTVEVNITPVLKPNEMRAVLTWNKSVDLDAFTIGDEFKTFFRDNKHLGDTDVYLDTDVTEGFGPETMTIVNNNPNDSFAFYVNYFISGDSDSNSNINRLLSESGAKVILYIGNDEKRVYNVPLNKTGSSWKVFEFENGQIIASNQMGGAAMVGYKSDGSID